MAQATHIAYATDASGAPDDTPNLVLYRIDYCLVARRTEAEERCARRLPCKVVG